MSAHPVTGTPLASGVGASLRQDSAHKHVTGAAIYIDDMAEPAGLLHAVLVTSDRPHARIVAIDGAAIAGLADVTLVTPADIPGVNDIAPIFSGEPCLAAGVVEYIGHPIAAVTAPTRAQALAAARLVKITYEDLPAVLDIATALAAESFVSPPQILEKGDWRAALAGAPRRLKGRVEVGGQDHFYLEGQIALAIPGEDRDMRVFSSTQHPTEVQHGVSHLLGVPAAQVTVEVRRLGGAFGGKESQATIIAGIAAVAAAKTRRPVKLRLSRDEDMAVTGKRHDFEIEWEVGFEPNGRILALDMLLAARAGNSCDLSPPVVTRAICHADNAYFIPATRLRGYACKTNTVSNTAFRGFGGPQGMMGIEAVIDQIARATGLGADQVRDVNYYGEAPRDVTPYGQVVEDNILRPGLARLEQVARLDDRRRAITAFNAASPVIRKGLAVMPLKFGISFNMPTLNQAGALVHVYTDGSVHLNHGGTEMGQGLFTKVAQVVAEVFQIEIDRIQISATATDKVPNTSATAASTGSDLNGMAAYEAAMTIRGRMTACVAEAWGVDAEAITFAGGAVVGGGKSISFAEAAKLTWLKRVSLSAAGFYRTPKIHWDQGTMQGRPFFYFAYGAAAAEVAIDTLTGEMRVLRADIIHDCGRSLNPAIDLGQIEGAFVQGMGWLTMEELWWDKGGRLKTIGPSTYKIPGSRDAPPEFHVHILDESPNREPTIFRSKAVGEPPLMLAISVWLAVRDAIASLADGPIEIPLDAPATPERILSAVDAVRAKSRERVAVAAQ